MANKKVIIIGGGIAGLCTGVYLRKCGFETEILEMHTISGGLATAWKKGGYIFENCVHWLVGSKEGGQLNAAWKEVFDIGRLKFFENPVFEVVERGAHRITIYRDPDQLEQELLAKAPEDAAAIKEFAGLVRKASRIRFTESDAPLAKLVGFIRMVPFLPTLSKYSKLTMADFGRKFKHPCLKAFFGEGLPDLSFLAIVMSLGWMAGGNAGYPIGGSLRMIRLIEENYKKLGGRIRFRARVERILVEDGRAVGVVLEGGKEIRGDVVISAADGHATLFGMLGGKYLSDKYKRVYETYKPFPSYVQVSLGVAAGLKGEPSLVNLGLDKKIDIDPGTKAGDLSFRIFSFDPTFATPGKTAVICLIATYNHDYWLKLREKGKARYESEKKRVAGKVIAVFVKRFPQAKGKVRVVDVATPATIIRYTGNWRGSMEGWLMTPATGIKTLPAVLPGLKNFYMVGQWISPGGGLPAGLMTGRAVSRRVCKENGLGWKMN